MKLLLSQVAFFMLLLPCLATRTVTSDDSIQMVVSDKGGVHDGKLADVTNTKETALPARSEVSDPFASAGILSDVTNRTVNLLEGTIANATYPAAPPLNLTYPHVRSRSDRHNASLPWPRIVETFMGWLFALGGGTGASLGDARTSKTSWDLERRMRYQDHAAVVLLLIIYSLALILGLSFTHWHCKTQAGQTASVAYYADQRQYNSVSIDNSLANFLEAFNCTPKAVCLEVTGYIPTRNNINVEGSVLWQDKYYFVSFTFALDLSSFVVQLDEPGIVPDDLTTLESFLAYNSNDLATVELQKHVEWAQWEELATNIKLQIRQRGFRGIVHINNKSMESLTIHKNKAWANFMHNRMTKVLCAMSLIGWIIYLPYMWIRYRCGKTVVHSRYRIDVSIRDYWSLIADRLSGDGFEPRMAMPDPRGGGATTLGGRTATTTERTAAPGLLNILGY